MKIYENVFLVVVLMPALLRGLLFVAGQFSGRDLVGAGGGTDGCDQIVTDRQTSGIGSQSNLHIGKEAGASVGCLVGRRDRREAGLCA